MAMTATQRSLWVDFMPNSLPPNQRKCPPPQTLRMSLARGNGPRRAKRLSVGAGADATKNPPEKRSKLFTTSTDVCRLSYS